MTNPLLQSLTMANVIVASRLPSEGNFRRDALLGAMVGQVNPMAGAVVGIRQADAVTALVQERDSLKAQQTAQLASMPSKTEIGKPASNEGRAGTTLLEMTREYMADATRLIDAPKNQEEARKFAEAVTPLIEKLKEALPQKAVSSGETNKSWIDLTAAMSDFVVALTTIVKTSNTALANHVEKLGHEGTGTSSSSVDSNQSAGGDGNLG